jgi:hypothetical protein
MADPEPPPYVPPAPVPYFDGQVKIGDEDQQLPEDPKAWFPNELKVFANGEKVHESLFVNHNADIRLECDGASLVGRVDPSRGPAQKVEASAPLEMKEEEETPPGPLLFTTIIHRKLGLKIAEPLQLDVDGALTLDPAFQPGGEVPPTVCFRAHKNGVNQTGVVSGQYTKVTFGTEEYDRGGYYNPTLSRWTPPAGLIHIDARAWCYQMSAASSFGLHIYKNGALYKHQWISASQAGSDGAIVNCDDIASGTDYYELFVYLTSATTGIVHGAVDYSYFSGHVPSGQQGEQGPIGLTGAVGPQGLQGTQGIQGPIGLTGATGPQGSQGIPGPQGATGPQGSQGDPGTPGSVWHQGSGAPGAALGVVGDFYLNTADGNVYRKTGALVWTVVGNIKGPQGIQGIQGIQGPQGLAAVWRNGNGAPLDTLGIDGDYYLNALNGNVYAKAAGTYTIVANILGPVGPTGAIGPQGPSGPQGIQGVKGDTGDVGPIGATGPQGIQGIQGEQGLQGVPGEVSTAALDAAIATRQPLDGDLTALAALTGTGIFYRSGTDTWSPVAIGENLSFTTGTLTAAGGRYTFAATAPASPTAGDLWYDSTTGSLSIYVDDGNSAQWVQISPANLDTSQFAPIKRTTTTLIGASSVTIDDCGKIFLLNNTNAWTSWSLGHAMTAAQAGAGFWYTVRSLNYGPVLIDPYGGELIDGLSAIYCNYNENFDVVCDGTNWYTLRKPDKTLIYEASSAAIAAYHEFTLPAGYSHYEFLISALFQQTSGATAVRAQLSTDGVNFHSTAIYDTSQAWNAGSTPQAAGAGTATSIAVLGQQDWDQARSGIAHCWLAPGTAGIYPKFWTGNSGFSSVSAWSWHATHNQLRNAGPALKIRFFALSGVSLVMAYKIWGIR